MIDVQRLLTAWLEGTDCRFAVRDAFLDMGLPSMATYYGDEKVGKERAISNRGFFNCASPADLEEHNRYLRDRHNVN